MENSNNIPTSPKKLRPRFNLNWLYTIIAVMLLALYFSNDGASASREVNYSQFQEYVKQGYIAKIVGYDDNTVEAYIKPQYSAQVFKADSSKVGRSPLILTEAPSRESLDKFLEKESEEQHFDGETSYKKRSNFLSVFMWQAFPFILIIGLWIFISRKWSGGGGGGQ